MSPPVLARCLTQRWRVTSCIALSLYNSTFIQPLTLQAGHVASQCSPESPVGTAARLADVLQHSHNSVCTDCHFSTCSHLRPLMLMFGYIDKQQTYSHSCLLFLLLQLLTSPMVPSGPSVLPARTTTPSGARVDPTAAFKAHARPKSSRAALLPHQSSSTHTTPSALMRAARTAARREARTQRRAATVAGLHRVSAILAIG